jgi:hypothetical protein
MSEPKFRVGQIVRARGDAYKVQYLMVKRYSFYRNHLLQKPNGEELYAADYYLEPIDPFLEAMLREQLFKNYESGQPKV